MKHTCLICNTTISPNETFCKGNCKDRLAKAKKAGIPIRIVIDNSTTIVTKKYDSIAKIKEKFATERTVRVKLFSKEKCFDSYESNTERILLS